MRLSKLAVLTGVAAIGFGLSALPAAAASKHNVPAVAAANSHAAGAVSSQTRTPHVVRQARAPTRITVHRRSFLDPGTEVLPGDEKYTDYVVSPSHRAMSVLENTAFNRPSALPGPFDLPGRNNPGQW
jgi:hypothetical protein